MIKSRSIVAAIIFTIITCGIYGLYWYVCMANDVNKISNDRNATSGGMCLLFSLLTCGIYSLFWMYKTGDTLDRVRAANGEPSSNAAILYLVLSIFGLGIVSYCLIQAEINRYADN